MGEEKKESIKYHVICDQCARRQYIHVENDHYSTRLEVAKYRCCYCNKKSLKIKKR